MVFSTHVCSIFAATVVHAMLSGVAFEVSKHGLMFQFPPNIHVCVCVYFHIGLLFHVPLCVFSYISVPLWPFLRH